MGMTAQTILAQNARCHHSRPLQKHKIQFNSTIETELQQDLEAMRTSQQELRKCGFKLYLTLQLLRLDAITTHTHKTKDSLAYSVRCTRCRSSAQL